jgi:alpha/beta superfamily hydrolase
MPIQKLTFQNTDGHQLSARLTMPADGKPLAYALFAHCFTCTKNMKAVRHISQAMMDQGIAVLQFDFTGLGESEGDFSDTNFSSNVDDLVVAAEFLGQQYAGPHLLIGHSLGGAAVLQAAASIPSCVAVATIGAPGNHRAGRARDGHAGGSTVYHQETVSR